MKAPIPSSVKLVTMSHHVVPRILVVLLCGFQLAVIAPPSLAVDSNLPLTVADERPVDAGLFDDLLAQQPTPVRPPSQRRRPEPPPGSTAPARPAPRAPSSSDFALEGATRSLGGAGSPTSVSPYMIGDFFSSGGQIFVMQGATGAERPVVIGEIPNAGGSLRIKISENNSPIPRDRVFYSYNEFVNAIPTFDQFQMTGAMDVDRHVPGFEKTFWDGLGSIELRTPIAYTQNSRVFLDGIGPNKNTEFGNIAIAAKFLLWQDDQWAFAAGTGVNVPTADDATIFQTGEKLLTIKNESVHLLPYVGFLWRPTELFYLQSFVQVDVAANGNTVLEQQNGRVGVLTEQTLLYADVAMGYWLFYDPDARYLTGITPTLEFHYTTTLQNADIINTQTSMGSLGLGNIYNRLDITNVTAGAHFWIGPRSVFTVAGAFPLASREDQRLFDAEIIAQFNRFF